MRGALHIQQNDAEYSLETLEANDAHATPPKHTFSVVASGENSAPVEEDSGFDQGQDG